MTDESRKLALQEKLADFKICIATNAEGIFTAYSESEPLFCYDGTSVEEVKECAFDTVKSYAKLFYEVDVNVKRHDEYNEGVLVERVKPVSSFIPELDLAA